jgi:ribosomal subunit interface protein
MQLNVRTHSADVDNADRAYAKEKIGRIIEKFLGKSGRVDVEFSEVSKGGGHNLSRVKVHIAIPHAPSETVHVDDAEVRTAIDLCADKVARVIKRNKQKRRDKARSGSFPAIKTRPAEEEEDIAET